MDTYSPNYKMKKGHKIWLENFMRVLERLNCTWEDDTRIYLRGTWGGDVKKIGMDQQCTN